MNAARVRFTDRPARTRQPSRSSLAGADWQFIRPVRRFVDSRIHFELCLIGPGWLNSPPPRGRLGENLHVLQRVARLAAWPELRCWQQTVTQVKSRWTAARAEAVRCSLHAHRAERTSVVKLVSRGLSLLLIFNCESINSLIVYCIRFVLNLFIVHVFFSALLSPKLMLHFDQYL